MRYRDFIQTKFLVDEPKTGKLVPFIFRDVQNKYYDQLVRDYDIERKGLSVPIRELDLKARRQGFSSFILALFASDDILSENATETSVISYKDDATAVFRKKYRISVLSCMAIESGYSVEDIQHNPNILESLAKQYFSKDEEGDYELRHNKAHFYCGTASAKVGGRGGVLHKLHFSELAFYPDKEAITAREIVEATLRQVDIEAGWVFGETTGKFGTYFQKMWEEAKAGKSRFKPRFFSWKELYTPEQIALIKSEFVDEQSFKREYPETEEDAFLSGSDSFFKVDKIKRLIAREGVKLGDWIFYSDYKPGHRYALGADVSEGVGRHNSTIKIIDFDAKIQVGNISVTRPEVVATYCSNTIAPDLFAYEIMSGATKYGNCIAGVERNNHGFTTLSKLKEIYFNIYQDEMEKLGWHTNMSSKPKMLHELNQAINEELLNDPDVATHWELISYPAPALNKTRVDEETDLGHWDRVIALAICWQMRGLAQPSMIYSIKDDDLPDKAFNRFSSPFNDLI